MQPRAGSLVTSNLRLVRQLGRGGMGSVWIAEHLTLHTEVAVKFISPEHADKQRFVRRFQREASSAAKIKNPHVVQIFDHGVTEEGVPYIVMELLEGETLASRLDRVGRLSLREVRLLVSQVARVLTLAHEQGIVHRDLKPDNLFLVESGYELFVKVLDFGIAKQTGQREVSELTDTGAVVGTPHYMSPEMVKSTKAIDHRADLWALGVVAYRALVGRLPFRGETFGAIAIAINEAEFEPPSSLVDGVGAEVDAWFRLALCRHIGGRFQSATELAQALRDATKQLASGEHIPGEDDLPPTARGAPAVADVAVAETVATPVDASGNAHDSQLLGAGDPTVSAADGDIATPSSMDETRTSADQRRRESQPADGERVSTLAGASADGTRARRRWPLAGVGAALVAAAAIAIGAGTSDESPSGPALELTATGESPSAPSAEADEAGQADVPEDGSTPSASAAPAASAPRPSASPSRGLRARPAPGPLPTPRPTPSATSKLPSGGNNCDPPFTVDANGDYVPKPECFPR